MNAQLSIAKITKPSVTGIYQRERLFRLLDESRKRPLVWIAGPAGSGKTTLIASYLDARNLPCLWYLLDEGDADPAAFFYYLGIAASKTSSPEEPPFPLLTSEYLQGIPVFTRRFVERLCGRLKPPFALVFDNYQDVPEGSIFHDIIAHGLEAIPEGITVFLVSRKEPPSPFARLRANNRMNFLGWEEIRFTLEESREIVRADGRSFPDESLEEIYRKTQGWMAGLILLMEGAKRGSVDQVAVSRLVPETIFDYFASEIFGKTDDITREFLLKTSFLLSLTAVMAEKLTQIKTSEQILSQLYRNHYFIEMRVQPVPTYHYHPLFREFLISKAKNFYSQQEIFLILRNAAALLEESGQIEPAALLLREAEDWEGLAGLVLKNAESLFNQGRGRTIFDWLESFPKNMVEANPWLLYWMGICKMFYNLVDSRSYLERSFERFKILKDPTGLYLSWSGVVNTYLYEWGDFAPLDRWITEMAALLREYPEFPSREITARVVHGMFAALAYRQPHHPDLPLWEQRLREIVLGIKDIKLQTVISSPLLVYYSWMTGHIAKDAFLLKTLKSVSQCRDTDPLPYIIWRACEASYYWMAASHEDCLRAVQEGLRTAEDAGIHLWDAALYVVGLMLNTTSGNLEEAEMFRKKLAAVMSPTAYAMVNFYYYTATFLFLCRGDAVGALEYARASLDVGLKSGMPIAIAVDKCAIGIALLDSGERKKGLAYIDDAFKMACSTGSNSAAYLCQISKAKYFLERNEEKDGLDALAKAMAIGRQQGFVNHSAWRDSVMSFLCAKALEAGIEVEYVQNLIRKRNLVPDASFSENENWPWPVRIYALGQFRIERDGNPLTFNGKVQKKPLETLRIMIANGWLDVSEMKVTDALWPDAEGDAAYQALFAAVKRLRKLLGHKETVQFQNGRMSLDPRFCWIDVSTFERIFKKADDAWKAGKKQKGLELYERAMNLYGGPLLGRESDKYGDITLRESLREKFIVCVRILGRDAEQHKKWEKAITFYRRALEVDGRTEEIYRLLMTCYARAGRCGDAADVYDRCRTMLRNNFREVPSAETEFVYQTIKKRYLK